MNSKYQQIEPKNDKLKEYIKLYYINESTDDKTVEKITYFPNFVTTINIYKNSKVTWDDLSRTHEFDLENNFQKLLVSKFDRSREIIMKGAFNKLTIVFHPLGINHFLKEPLSNYAKDHFSFLEHLGKSFDELIEQVFSSNNIVVKRDLLDDYFVSNYIGFKEKRLSVSIKKIFESHGNIAISDLANQLKISRKTILRLFKKHLNLSPTEYKSIVKFRRALNTYQNKTQKPNLSSLAYEALYYDQSDLNFHFKQRTGLTPHQLFLAIESIEDGLHWKIDHVPKVQDID